MSKDTLKGFLLIKSEYYVAPKHKLYSFILHSVFPCADLCVFLKKYYCVTMISVFIAYYSAQYLLWSQ